MAQIRITGVCCRDGTDS